MFRIAVLVARVVPAILAIAAVVSVWFGSGKVNAIILPVLLLIVVLLQVETLRRHQRFALTSSATLKSIRRTNRRVHKMYKTDRRKRDALARGLVADDLTTLLRAIEEQHLGRMDRMQDRLEMLLDEIESQEPRNNK